MDVRGKGSEGSNNVKQLSAKGVDETQKASRDVGMGRENPPQASMDLESVVSSPM